MLGYCFLLSAFVVGGLNAPWGAAVVLAAILTLPKLQFLSSNAGSGPTIDFPPLIAVTFLNNAIFTLLSFGLGRAVALIVL